MIRFYRFSLFLGIVVTVCLVSAGTTKVFPSFKVTSKGKDDQWHPVVGVENGKPLVLGNSGLEQSPIYYTKAEKTHSVNDLWVDILSVEKVDDPKNLVLDVKLKSSEALQDAYAVVSYLGHNDKGHAWPACKVTSLPDLTGQDQALRIKVDRKDIRDGEWRLHVYHTGVELYDSSRKDLVDASPKDAFRLNLRRHFIATGAGDAAPAPFYMPVNRPPEQLLPSDDAPFIVKVKIKIGADGQVASFDYISEINPELANHLSRSINDWLFFPQIKQGKPVERSVAVPLQLK